MWTDRWKDGRTDTRELLIAFRSFAKSPKYGTKHYQNFIYRLNYEGNIFLHSAEPQDSVELSTDAECQEGWGKTVKTQGYTFDVILTVHRR